MIKTYSYLVKNTKKAHEVWNKHNPNNKIKEIETGTIMI
jgi:hypothetical protein